MLDGAAFAVLAAACGQLSAMISSGATTEMLNEAMNTVQRAMAGY